MPHENVATTTIIDKATLTNVYNGGVCGEIDLTGHSDQVILYTRWEDGQADATLAMMIWTSPNNDIFYPLVHELISAEGTSTIEDKEFLWHYVAANYVYNEYSETVREDMNGVGSSRKFFNIIPTTGTTPTVRHDGTAYGTVTEVVNDAGFTAPADMAADVIEWSLATGALNLNATDLAADDGETLTLDYQHTDNLLRIPIPVRDRFIRVAFREIAGKGGALTCAIDSNWDRRK